MNRRTVIGALGAMAAAGIAARAQAEHEHHAGHGAGSSPYAKLQVAASLCVANGQVCLAHCIRLLGQGDKGMADCAAAVDQMLAVCGALQDLAGQGSTLTPALARVALEACKRCGEACKPHIEHHAECKACYVSCQECMEQCKAAAG